MHKHGFTHGYLIIRCLIYNNVGFIIAIVVTSILNSNMQCDGVSVCILYNIFMISNAVMTFISNLSIMSW
jgi:hypothetical protein